MKILYYFMQYNTSMYTWQNKHIIDELLHHDIIIEIFNPLNCHSKDIANNKVIDYLKTHKYDLFMTCHDDTICYTETLQEIKKIGVPILLICFDSLMTPLKHRKVAPLADVVMISQKDEFGYFKKYNANTIVSHYAANPYFFTPNYTAAQTNRLAFPGTPYGSRAVTIKKLADAGVPIDLYFNNASQIQHFNPTSFGTTLKVGTELLKYSIGRKIIKAAIINKIKNDKVDIETVKNIHHFNSVSLAETNNIYASHDLSLSIAVARNTGVLKEPIQIVHLRNFEIPMSGGVQFCEYFSELAECFEDDKEIIFYHNREEMIDKAQYWLRPENEKRRLQLRINARKRSENEHTWFKRFSKAFESINLKYK